MEVQLVKFSEIHYADGTKLADFNVEIEDSFEDVPDVLQLCNSEVEHRYGFKQPVYYRVDYVDKYWNEPTHLLYSTYNKYWGEQEEFNEEDY